MNRRSKQHGAASLIVTVLLLMGMSLIAFFANKGLIFEQRTSANQYRSTKAFEMADAGAEWAIARLNDPLTLAAADSCAPATGAGLVSFRDRYIRPTAADALHTTGWLNPLDTAYPGCQIDPTNGSSTCACPSTGAAVLASTDWPRFRVQFRPLPDLLSVEIISRGCTNGDPCDPSQAPAASDGTAIVRVILKIRPTFPTIPGAGLISGSTTVVSGSLNVINTDTASNGITINTGSTVQLTGGTLVQTLPGTSPTASILDNDPSLLQLTNADANGELFFSSYFGEGFDSYKSNLQTKVISAGASDPAGGTCNSEVNCGAAVSYWIDQGYTQFWVEPSVTFNNSNMPSTTSGTLGTAANPIALATPNQMTFTGGINAFGTFYAATTSAIDDLTLAGGGSANIVGSLVSRGDFSRTGNGNISIIYDANLFGAKGAPSGLLVPVPGSWRDKASAY
jgi:hypothetical protein